MQVHCGSGRPGRRGRDGRYHKRAFGYHRYHLNVILRWTHLLLVALYCGAPVVAIAVTLLRRARGRRPAGAGGGGIAVTISAAIILGSALSLALTIAVGSRIRLGQVALTVYFLAALMLLLRGADAVLVRILRGTWFLVFGGGGGGEDEPADAPQRSRPPLAQRLAAPLPTLVRAALLLFVGVPYLMAVAMVYRPKVVSRVTPNVQLGVRYDDVRFETSDGLSLSGWWIPSPASSSSSSPRNARGRARSTPRVSDRTVIICHGFASGKAAMLPLARPMLAAGYNVLIFDFRAHGQSDGQLTSLGANERLDVLAAVQWLRANRDKQSQHVFGLGASSGAAALIAAAADASEEGQAIEAVAVYGAYDSLPGLARTVASERFLPPLRWIADRVALPIASAHVGADLVHFAPADYVKQLWPRPILVIHGAVDQVVPFQHGQRLFDAAFEPRRSVWLQLDDHLHALEDKSAASEVREFFDDARPVPVI